MGSLIGRNSWKTILTGSKSSFLSLNIRLKRLYLRQFVLYLYIAKLLTMNNNVISFLRRILIIVGVLLIGIESFAQGSFTVKLKLVDTKTDEPVSFATASLTVKGGNTAAKYVLTDADGSASETQFFTVQGGAHGLCDS